MLCIQVNIKDIIIDDMEYIEENNNNNDNAMYTGKNYNLSLNIRINIAKMLSQLVCIRSKYKHNSYL